MRGLRKYSMVLVTRVSVSMLEARPDRFSPELLIVAIVLSYRLLWCFPYIRKLQASSVVIIEEKPRYFRGVCEI
jgi:hypothetical protein